MVVNERESLQRALQEEMSSNEQLKDDKMQLANVLTPVKNKVELQAVRIQEKEEQLNSSLSVDRVLGRLISVTDRVELYCSDFMAVFNKLRRARPADANCTSPPPPLPRSEHPTQTTAATKR